MPKPDARGAAGLADLARMAANAFLERLGERMSDLSRDVLRLYPNSVERWLLFKPDRYALLHGDYRLDNIMFGPDGSVTVVDWQTIAVGLPARDLAYFLSTSLTPDRRRVHERRVVAAHDEALKRHGVTDYSAEESWQDYRLGMLHAPLIATLEQRSRRPRNVDAMMLVMLERASAAIHDLDTLAVVDKETS